jgi:hypothetical protein
LIYNALSGRSRRGRRQAQWVRDRAHGFDAEGDVLVEGNAQLLGALGDVLAADGAREGLILHPLAHRTRFEAGDSIRPNQRTRREEAGELVARKQDFRQWRIARRISSETPFSYKISLPFSGWSGAFGYIS